MLKIHHSHSVLSFCIISLECDGLVWILKFVALIKMTLIWNLCSSLKNSDVHYFPFQNSWKGKRKLRILIQAQTQVRVQSNLVFHIPTSHKFLILGLLIFLKAKSLRGKKTHQNTNKIKYFLRGLILTFQYVNGELGTPISLDLSWNPSTGGHSDRAFTSIQFSNDGYVMTTKEQIQKTLMFFFKASTSAVWCPPLYFHSTSWV